MCGRPSAESARGAFGAGAAVTIGTADESERSSSGFILVTVLWMLGALATLASVYALYTSNSAVSARVMDDRLQAEASIASALDLTALRLSGVPEATRPSQGSFAFRVGRSKIIATFRSEGARIDLNFASKELLTNLLVVLGARPSDADAYAERIIGWRTKRNAADFDAEASLYRKAGLAFKPRGDAFQSVAELSSVFGLPSLWVERALPFLTIFNGRPDIDVMTASPEVLAALPGMTRDLLRTVLDQRVALDRAHTETLLTAIRANGVAANAQPRDAVRVTVRVLLDNGREIGAEAVIVAFQTGDEPYRVLSWNDDFDGP